MPEARRVDGQTKAWRAVSYAAPRIDSRFAGSRHFKQGEALDENRAARVSSRIRRFGCVAQYAQWVTALYVWLQPSTVVRRIHQRAVACMQDAHADLDAAQMPRMLRAAH